MWLLDEIQTEMQLGKIKEYLSYKQIKQKCIDNGVTPKIAISSDNKICTFAITDEEFHRLFKHEDYKNGSETN